MNITKGNNLIFSGLTSYLHPLKKEEFRKCIATLYQSHYLRNWMSLSDSKFREEAIKKIKSVKKTLLEKCDDKKVLKKSVKIFKEVLSSFNDLKTDKPWDRDYKFDTIMTKWRREYFKTLGIVTIKEDFPCYPSHFLGAAPKIASKGLILCMDYAFLQLGEEKFSSLLGDLCSTDCVKILEDWGYLPVNYPQPGDLVVYGNMINDQFEAKHYGILTEEEEKVLSKWGDLEVFEHPLPMGFDFYGDFVVFFRKPIYQEVLQNLVKELDNSKKRYEYSTTFIEQFKVRFTEILKEKLNACHTQSLAYHFFVDWLEAFPAKIDEEFDEGIEIAGTAELLLNLLEDTTTSIPLNFEKCRPQIV
jgi:hypothetical protein